MSDASAKPWSGAAIETRSLTRNFDTHRVLRGVDLELTTTHALAGDNGSGKTTLLRILAGLLRPSAGEARILGREVGAHPDVAYLGQQPGLYGHLTGKDHMDWWTRMHRSEAIEVPGVTKVWLEPTRAWSRGQRQRLALGLAFASNPKLMLLDEPTTALDATGRQWFLDQLEGRTALVASHEELGLPILRLHRGQLENQ